MRNNNPNRYNFSRAGLASITETPDVQRGFSVTAWCFGCGRTDTARGGTLRECNEDARRAFRNWARIETEKGIQARAYCPICADRLLNSPEQERIPTADEIAAGWVNTDHAEHDANGTA